MDQSIRKGRLSFSVGETLLSAWEAARLSPGDVVLTTRQAGYPGFLLFNNLPIGLGEVVILDQVLGVRVVDSDFRPGFQVDPGRIDELGELVPTLLELGSVNVDLDQLRGLGRNSILNLGCPYQTDVDGMLRYAGFPLARGKVVVVGELMGLRVVDRLVDLPTPRRVLQSGNLADRVSVAQAKDYNFSMPDKWSREQIRRLEDIHRLFQRNWEASDPRAARMLEGRTDGILVDQCTLGEARALLSTWGLESFQTWEHGPFRGRSTGEERPQTPLFEAEDCPFPFTQETRKSLEARRSVRPGEVHRPVFLHPGSWSDEDLRVISDCLRNGWKKLMDFRLDPVSLAIGPSNSDNLNEHEMVILVLVRKDASTPPVLALVYPFLTLESSMNLLGS